MGFEVWATGGTATYLRARGIPTHRVFKVHEGRPNCLDMIVNRDIQLLINTPLGKHAQLDDYLLRQAAIVNRVSYTTTMSAASAASDAIVSLKSRAPRVKSLQEWQAELAESRAAVPGATA
jgi:carbamoyl-phosphate synthase large subunit